MLLGLLGSDPIYTLFFIIALLTGLTVHEFAHAWVATKLGDPTSKLEGRLTLNPVAHLDPMGTVFLLLVGFGWGKPVPIDPRYFKNKTDEIKVALAGIVVNLALAAIIVVPLKSLLATGAAATPLILFLSLLVLFNIILAVFNLLPIPPLDGSHVVEYFLSDEMKNEYQVIGPFLLFGLIFAQYFLGFSIISNLVEPVVRFIAGNQIANLFF